jgi:DNA polymerase
VTYSSDLKLLSWYLEAGANEAIGDEPINHFKAIIQPPKITQEQRKIPENQSLPEIISLKTELKSQILAQSCQNLGELKQALMDYEECSLKKTSKHTVFADGNPEAKVMIIYESPDHEDDELGKPFAGASGQLLDKILQSIGLSRETCYLSPIIPWRPPGNRLATLQEIDLCLPFIIRHIELIAPHFLVLLGGPTSKALLGNDRPISQLRGQWIDFVRSKIMKPIPSIVTYHPAYLLKTPSQKKLAWQDYRLLKNRME